MLKAATYPTSSLIFHLSTTGAMFRQLDPQHIEVWGEDISEHYLLCYDEQQTHLVDVFYIPFYAQLKRIEAEREGLLDVYIDNDKGLYPVR